MCFIFLNSPSEVRHGPSSEYLRALGGVGADYAIVSRSQEVNATTSQVPIVQAGNHVTAGTLETTGGEGGMRQNC